MNIIIEGLDGSGKSTLAALVSKRLGWPVLHSSGPAEKFVIYNRAEEFLAQTNTIFDRHVCVSEMMYGRARGYTQLEPQHVKRFYDQENLFIYCKPDNLDHVEKAHDSPGHLKLIREKHQFLHALYTDWAYANAHIMRQPRDLSPRLLNMIEAYVR